MCKSKKKKGLTVLFLLIPNSLNSRETLKENSSLSCATFWMSQVWTAGWFIANYSAFLMPEIFHYEKNEGKKIRNKSKGS